MLSKSEVRAPLVGTSQAPGAQGTVEAREGDNGNTEIDLKVKHLAEPGKIAPGAQTYIVWARSREPNRPIQNLGALIPSRDLEGELKAMTPLRDFEVIVTPEPSAQETKPTNPTILSTSIRR